MDYFDDLTGRGEVSPNAPSDPIKLSNKETTSQVLTIRGNAHGLVLRIDGGAEWSRILSEIDDFFGGRRKFFKGGQVVLEWLGSIPPKGSCQALEEMLEKDYGLIIGRRNSRLAKEKNKDNDVEKLTPQKPSLEVISGTKKDLDLCGEEGEVNLEDLSDNLAEELLVNAEVNARIVYTTLRSGQRVETPFSLIIIGDVNPGADIIAGGDIIVLGNLRGTAHAGAFDDDFQDRIIVALSMQPVQLRIGSIISRGSGEATSGIEVARIEDRRILVENYVPKVVLRNANLSRRVV